MTNQTINTKLYHEGDKSVALCELDGQVTTTFEYRDMPVKDSHLVVPHILVGVCDTCKSVVSIPAQSTPEIKKSLES